MFIDSHCHLDFYDESERPDIIAQALNTGVSYMLNSGASKDSFDTIIKIANENPSVFGAIGIHPHEAESMESILTAGELIAYSQKSNKIIALGETGLDYSHDAINKDIQMENFQNHIDASRTTGLPLIIHNRDSNDDLCNILEREMKKQEFKAIIHCFTADESVAKRMLDLNFYISASGIITFKTATYLQEIFKNIIPNNKILIETDSPYLAPTLYRGTRNEPAYVVEMAKILAELKGVSLDEMGNITSTNFATLFNLTI